MKNLFLKSNIPHIRTNEGEFEVSNPEVLTYLHIRHMPDGDWRIKTPGSGWTGEDVKWPVEWPGGVEFETIAPHPECNKARECLQLTNGLNCSQAYNARTRSTSLCAKAYKLARLIPEENKPEYLKDKVVFDGARTDSDTPMSFTESAYKEFEGKDSDSGDGLSTIGSNNRETKVESSEPQEKSIESEKYELRRILQMQVNCLREDEMDNSDAVAIRGTTAQRIMKFLDPVYAPSESQEEIFDDLWDDILKWYEEDNPEIDWYTKRHELKKKFTITRNP